MEELYSKCGSRPCPRRATILNTIDGISEKSMDQQKIFGTNRARHGATPEFTLPKTWEPPATGKPGAISHFCVQQPVNMT